MHRLLVLLLLLPAAAAQPLLEDDAGDAAGAAASGVDLRSLDIEEDAAGFRFTIAVEALESAMAGTDAGMYDVWFDHSDRRFVLRLGIGVGGGAWGNLYRFDPVQETYSWLSWTGAVVDAQAATVSAYVERDDLADGDGAAPLAGRTLDAFVVETRAWHGQGTDRMPDSGQGPAWEVQAGPAQQGMRLWSAAPFRASNGGASVYAFEIHADNEGDVDDTYHLETGPVPEGWQVHLPASVAVPAQGRATFEVAVKTGSAHQHDGRDVLRLEAHGANTSAVGRMDIGIRYLAVPQPAGHHPTLWVHSAQNGAFASDVVDAADSSTWQRRLYMNTLEDHEGDAGVPVKGRWASPTSLQPGVAVDAGFQFPVFLDPGLEIGLAMDVEREGEAQVTFRSPVPVLEARLSGGLWHCARDLQGTYHCQALASVTSPAQDLEADRETLFDVTLTPSRDAAHVPYEREAYLTLVLVLQGTRPTAGTGADAPEMLPGGRIDLPLLEYADPAEVSWEEETEDATRQAQEPRGQQAPGLPALATVALLAWIAVRRR